MAIYDSRNAEAIKEAVVRLSSPSDRVQDFQIRTASRPLRRHGRGIEQ